MIEKRRTTPPPLVRGSVINDRYEIRYMIGKGGMGEVFLADDRATRQPVALKIVRADAHLPGDDELLRREMINARKISSPNVCRVYDLIPSDYGPILLMEYIDGKTLHAHIRDRNARGGYTCDELRRIAADVCQGVAAIHAGRLVHGDIKPGNVMITSNPDGTLDKALLLDFGFAQDPGQVAPRGPGGTPHGGTANYQSHERIETGAASIEDDLYALGLTLWEMWTCAVPEPGANPRHRPMPRQTKYDVLAGLSVDEIKQIFWCLSEDPSQRISAKNLRFFNPTTISISASPARREKLDARAPPGTNAGNAFSSGTQSLLVTFAPNAPELVGTIHLLDQPTLTIGRGDDMNVVLPEPTVSGHHATLTWASGAWQLEDVGSTSGTYVDYPYTPRKQLTWRHSAEVQLGELRLKLVGFEPGSRAHKRARAFLARRDGLTGMLDREHLEQALIEECLFSDWAEQPLSVARYDISTPREAPTERPTITELLGLRQAATRVVEVMDGLLLSLIAVTAGRTGPRSFAVILIGPKLKEAQNLVDHVVDQVRRTLPLGLDLNASVFRYEPDTDPRWLIGST
jgi:serine/threonine-protein kinase